jgi:hypothetical protein
MRKEPDAFTYAIAIFTTLGVILALTWILQGQDFFLYKFFAPRYEAARRETFEESKSYNDGMQQDLRRMQGEYIKATPAQQEALASVIIHQFAAYDERKLSPDLRTFLDSLKSHTTETIR